MKDPLNHSGKRVVERSFKAEMAKSFSLGRVYAANCVDVAFARKVILKDLTSEGTCYMT